jgi:hypothetical protein
MLLLRFATDFDIIDLKKGIDYIMTKQNRQRIVEAIEEHNKNVPDDKTLDVHEVFDAIDTITDDEADDIIAQIENNYKN